MTDQRPRDFDGSRRDTSSPRGSLVASVLDLFSRIWLGVFLLAVLFVYSSIGSAGMPIGPGITRFPFFLRPDAWVSVREIMEITEFEWFHWWPFDVIISLICVNLVVATLRRIPFNVVNLGVWMIHSGIIVLAIGSVWYFGTKVEGDAPVARRRVVARIPGHEPVSFVASPGNRAQIGTGGDAYLLEVASIAPSWPLLSGDDAGRRAYKVSVRVQTATQSFIRELIAGYPQYSEDLVRSGDPAQPVARAKKALGTALVDETLSLALEYDPQRYFYLMQSSAVYLREVGAADWVERPIRRLPRFNDHVSNMDRVWTAPGDDPPPLRPIDIAVPPVAPDDPLPLVTFRISDYLRYAMMDTRRLPDATRFDPAETRPLIVPKHQRNRDIGVQASMIRLELPAGAGVGGGGESNWLSYHMYPFARPQDVLRRFRYEPTVMHLPDGRDVEVMFSRERMVLPTPVVLDDFELATHVGGYSGASRSVRNWTSVVRFREDDGWSQPARVSVNDPQEHGGFWFFQSQWDPPSASSGPGDPGSDGLNYTVLGVGNREGVLMQLLGCCLSVIGMIYAFYVKPVIRRRRQAAAYRLVIASAEEAS